MDKTVSISLGGFSFIMDENAYAKLRTYLQDVSNSLRGTEGIEDIIEDVEIRISELFRERIKYREVVNNDDVDFVIATMGHPDQYKVEEEDFEEGNTSTNSSSYTNSTYGPQNKKRLFRDPDDKIITGLSAGLAHYLGLDPWAVRATWLVLGILGLFTGVSFLLVVFCYFVMLIFVPKAQSTSEKLQMYGKPANIETLKKNVEQAGDAVVSGGRELSNKLGGAFGVFGKMLLWFIGFLILCTGIGLIIGGFALFFTTWTEMPTELFGYLVEEEWMSITTKILGGILMIIPGVLITVLGVRCFTNIKTSKALIVGSIVAWFIALFTIIGISLSTASKFRNSVETTKDQIIDVPSDTLVVNFRDHSAKNYKYKTFNDLDQLIDEEGNLIIPIRDEFSIKPSYDNKFKVEVKYSSHGGSNAEAKRNLESIVYNFDVNGKEINLDEFIKIPKNGKFRNQTVDVTLYIPQNKYVLAKNAEEVNVYFDDEYAEDYYYDIHNKLFMNNGKKIVCLNCQNDDDSNENYNHQSNNNNDRLDININDGTDSAKVIIDQNGIRVKGKDGSVGVSVEPNSKSKNSKNQHINYKDDTDSINIDYGNNKNNR